MEHVKLPNVKILSVCLMTENGPVLILGMTTAFTMDTIIGALNVQMSMLQKNLV